MRNSVGLLGTIPKCQRNYCLDGTRLCIDRPTNSISDGGGTLVGGKTQNDTRSSYASSLWARYGMENKRIEQDGCELDGRLWTKLV